MASTQQRADRVESRFPVSFHFDKEHIQGMCENLSESGILATFAEPLDVWTSGELDLHFGIDLLGIKARVARTVGLQAGLSFLKCSEVQQAEICELICSIQNGANLPKHLVSQAEPDSQ